MVLTEKALRNMIRSQIRLIREADEAAPGDIKGTAASQKASEKLESNTAIMGLLKDIDTPAELGDLLQNVINTAAKTGKEMKPSDIVKTLQNLITKMNQQLNAEKKA